MPQIVDHGLGDLVGREAIEAEPGQHASGLVERSEHRKVVDPRQLEVLRARTRRDVDDARPLVEHDVVPRNHPMHDPLLCR